MKKLFTIILSIGFIISLSGCLFDDVSFLYNDTAEKDGFDIVINKSANCCYVAEYKCVDYTDGLEITIPDDYEGIPIKRIGGYYGRGLPMPFSISLADLYMNAPKDSKYDAVFGDDIKKLEISEDYTVEEIVFRLNIGENIEVIENVEMDNFYPHINEDGSITFYHPVVSVNCSDKNKRFYSKDGKLYTRNTDELVSVFSYQE